MKTTHLVEKRNVLIEKREKLIDRFNQATRARKSTTRVCTEIRRTNDFIESLERIEAENTIAQNTAPRRYAVSSLFLHDCAEKLTADKNEQFFFITGAEVEGVLVLDQWAEFAHQKRSRLGVVADTPSNRGMMNAASHMLKVEPALGKR